MPFQKPDIYEKVWKRIQAFINIVEHSPETLPNLYSCNLCEGEYKSRDPGRMCAHFQSLHKDAIAFGVLAE